MLPIPKSRHSNCNNDGCQTCLADAQSLQEYLEEKTGITWRDTLGDYRKWLDNNNIPAETDHGWFTDNVFKPENIAAYIESWNQ
jgi:hypothetical protein